VGHKGRTDVQMRTHGFLSGNVVDVSAGDAETAGGSGEAARARAGGGDGAEVAAVGGVAEVEGAGGGYGVAEALGGGGGLRIIVGRVVRGEADGLNRGKERLLTAVLLGQTQSNMSAPKAMQTTRSSG